MNNSGDIGDTSRRNRNFKFRKDALASHEEPVRLEDLEEPNPQNSTNVASASQLPIHINPATNQVLQGPGYSG